VAARLGLEVTTDPDLDEVTYGHWTGAPFDTLRHDPGWQPFQERRSTRHSPGGGESLEDVRRRAARSLQRLTTEYADACVAVVTHGDVIKAIASDVLGLPLDAIHRFDVDPASRTVVVSGEWGTKLLMLN